MCATVSGEADNNIDPWFCSRCKDARSLNDRDDNVDLPWDQASIHDRCSRLGLQPKPGADYRTLQRKMDKTLAVLQQTMPQRDLELLKNSTPQPYPTLVPMDNAVVNKHVIHGRRFEVSMSCFITDRCDCCGQVEPGHSDPSYKESAKVEPLTRLHLVTQWFPAWCCTCPTVCGGEQF